MKKFSYNEHLSVTKPLYLHLNENNITFFCLHYYLTQIHVTSKAKTSREISIYVYNMSKIGNFSKFSKRKIVLTITGRLDAIEKKHTNSLDTNLQQS